MNTYRMISVMVEIKDEDISKERFLSVAGALPVDLSKLSESVDEDERRRYEYILADEAVKSSLPELVGESRSFIDFKLSTGDIEVAQYHIFEHIEGVSIVPQNQEVNTLRYQLSSRLRDSILENLTNIIKEFAPAILVAGGKIPTSLYIEMGSEYDDSNYYTDVSDVRLTDGTSYTSIDTEICTITDYGFEDLPQYLREVLRDDYGTSEIEIAGLNNELVQLEEITVTPEEIEEAKKKMYKITKEHYTDNLIVYDNEDVFDITGREKEEYEKGQIVPYLEYLKSEEQEGANV